MKVENLEQATSFYETAMGLKVLSRTAALVAIETGAFMLYLEPGSPPGPVCEYLVGNLQETKKTLLAAGCVVLEEDVSVPRCYLRDPFGMTFNLSDCDPEPA